MIGPDMFDEYGRKAQLYPALLVFLPPLATAIILFPGLLSLKGTIGALIVGSGALYMMANIGRDAGRRKQGNVFPDGLPSQCWLRHRDASLETPTKDRYKEYLSRRVTGISFPSAAEEQDNSKAADEIYRSAARWLVDNTRSNKRVRQELIAYGFRRNLYGLKPWGLAISVSSAAIASYIMHFRHELTVSALKPEEFLVLIAGGIVVPAIWIFVVKESWVKSVADSYALALFGHCDENIDNT